MKNLKLLVLAIVGILAISSCSKNDDPVVVVPPPVVNEEEVLTTVTVVFTPVGGGTVITLKSRDLDGDGPGVADITGNTVPFALNKTYNTDITVLNESVSPTVNVTTEIITEAVDHQFFYQKTGTLPVFNYTSALLAPTNYDVNGKPLGIKTTFVTTTAATGTLKVTLRHEGNKSAAGVSTGDITNATGATDFEVNFPGLSVQ